MISRLSVFKEIVLDFSVSSVSLSTVFFCAMVLLYVVLFCVIAFFCEISFYVPHSSLFLFLGEFSRNYENDKQINRQIDID